MENWEKQEELKNEIKTALKGELDESATKYADILFHDELSRGRVLNRLYKLFSSELELAKQEGKREERTEMEVFLNNRMAKDHMASLHQNNNKQGGK